MSWFKDLAIRIATGARKNAPAIKTTLCVGGVIGGTILTWRAAIKTNDILKESDAKLAEIDEKVKAEEITAEEADKTKKDIRKQEIWRVTKACSGAGIVTIGTIALGIENTVTLTRQLKNARSDAASAAAAAFAVSSAFKRYRDRVREDQGEEKDLEYRYGANKVEVVDVKEDGTTEKHTIMTVNREELEQDIKKFRDYSFILDCNNWSHWTGNENADLSNIRLIERELNGDFTSPGGPGFMWYNDVRRAYGQQPVADYGWEDGWIYDPTDPNRSCRIEVNVYNFSTEKASGKLDPNECIYLIELNVEGPINAELKKRGWISEE